ncbi:hypothetical protein P43SY_005407 [Pythium insidiosum]|uniref:SAM domain-containing protein n=1 Tax=Pythium insidiosum TaxID=114742 RepID=A0AAD5L984_PYTIN|nr:hypothetical protein P43SY_005407 [Pythium insidiosum]KAJ0396537.1 hypothetical protein ATCC90586_005069 [Pythium insidiosum]
MPVTCAAPTTSMPLRDEDLARAAPLQCARKAAASGQSAAAPPSPSRRTRGSAYATDEDDDESDVPRPLSPRVRKRLDEAKENESVFCAVREQGEVIQWMSACHPTLIQFGRDLERRGFKTLSSVAFLTDDDLDASIDPLVRQHLLAMLTRLRHEFFRM